MNKPGREEMSHEDFYNAALEAIDEVFSDTSVSQGETLESLRDLRSEIDAKMNAIRADIQRAEKGRSHDPL